MPTFFHHFETSSRSEREEIAPRDRDLEYLMLGLRTAHGVEKSEFENRFRLPFSPIEKVLEGFTASGHTAQTDGRWHLTAEGWLVSNAIILAALEALHQEKERRARAAADGDFRILP